MVRAAGSQSWVKTKQHLGPLTYLGIAALQGWGRGVVAPRRLRCGDAWGRSTAVGGHGPLMRVRWVLIARGCP